MEITHLEALEQKYKFQYPKLYKQLCEEGMLSTGKFGPNWYKENYPRLKDNPLFLLWSNEVELIEEFELEEYISDMEDPDMWNMKSDLKLIPFAQNHGGDLYCFYYNEQQGNDVPITLLNHDSDYFTVLSKNMQDFIFRILLETYSDLNITLSSAFSEQQKEEKKKQVIADGRAMLNNHKRYLKSQQCDMLEDIYANELKNDNSTWGFITKEEVKHLLKQEIDFPLLDKEIIYTEDNQ